MSAMSDQDYQHLVHDFNATDDISLLGGRLDQLFEKVVDRFPDNIAVIHDEHEVTFRNLNASANVLARGLARRGVQHGDVVGLAVSRSIDLVAVMLAVLKLGAAYVPIDPSFPAERINQMVEDAGPRLILLRDSPTKGLVRWTHLCLSVGEARHSSITDDTNLETDIEPGDLAYIIYTSGSTGRPKGVEISHGASANFLGSLRKHEPGCDEHDRLLAITTISFDMSALELLLPLLSGSAMIIANTSAVKDPRELIGLVRRHQVTILQATPATWTMLLESGWKGNPRLSKIICGGEPLTRQLADRLLAAADSVWNVYGPSETTYGSVGRVGEGDIVVGNPVANGRIYVLDDNMAPVPIGCEGEVYIGGGSVSNGYRNKAELTRSRFLRNPFHGGVFFRTGDLARFIGPGKLQVIGRMDGVVKIRGHRIDVGDIEAVLVDHENVSEAAVISRDDRLVAYCVLHTPCHDAALLDRLLRAWVSERLPPYMLPTFFVEMDALPLSPSEKINRRALPDPIQAMQNQSPIQPSSKLEREIQAIWSDILGHSHFGIEDSFFHMGGDSVRIIRMQAALEKQLHRPVPTPKLFEHYTIKALAAYLAGTGKEDEANASQHQTASQGITDGHEDIAVISMACRLPGGVATPEAFWQLLQNGGDTIIDVPRDRWDADKLYSADPDVDGTSYCRRGGFLDSIYSYDASFFGMSPREAQAMDPTHNLMLELCWEGFERAGYTRDRLRGSATGVYIGVSNNGTTRSSTPPDLTGYSITGSASATMCGRLSYILGLQGPSLAVDTACSSSLVAAHLACNALRQGECGMALAGGVSLLTTPGIHVEFSKLRGLSADGRCKAFSEDTDGTGFSEGAVVVVLKRLSDARRDGDDIHAVLRGTAVMHGGSSASLTAPNVPGQVALIRNALARAAMAPGDVDYVEAHGTATRLGDPIEAAALAQVFSPGRSGLDPLRIGSAKSNIGHTQAAAGLVGLLKIVLSMQNTTLPRTLHVSKATTAVDWQKVNMELVLANRPWLPSNHRLRRAGVSAFGIGGTNAHVLVEEPPRPVAEDSGVTTLPFPAAVPFVLSGQSHSALRAQAEKLRLHMESGVGKDSRLRDVAYSLATTRSHFQKRLVVTARDKPEMLEKLASVSSGCTKPLSVPKPGSPRVGMLFTGQGSQLPGMGKDLYAVYPVFRDALDQVAANFAGLALPILDIMWAELGSSSASLLSRTDFAQPALFALEVSLWRLWQSWGVKADFLLGHSVGEIAAAHVAGVLDLRDACRLVAMRGRLMQAIPLRGTMASVEASSEHVTAVMEEKRLADKVEIAGYNTPSQTVISGDSEAVETMVFHVRRLGRKTKLLDTSHAFHSFHMNGMLDDFKAVVQTMRFSPPKIPVISSMTGRLVEAGELEQPEYWARQVRNPVRFSDAFLHLAGRGVNVFLELGPSPALCGLGAACLADASQVSAALWLPSLKADVDGASVIQNSMSELHARHVPVDWAAYFEPFDCKRVMLPTYAFQRETFRPASSTSWPEVMSPSTEVGNAVSGVQEMVFEINWRRVETKNTQPGGAWGLVCPSGETAWTEETQEALLATGIQLVPVSRLHEAGQLDGLLFLWDSGDDDTVQMAHGFTIKAVAQLQEATRTGFAVPMVWVTRHAVGAGAGDRPVHIGAGPLWGLARAARSEHPELRLRLIDVDEATDGTALSLALMLPDQTEVAIRREQLLTPHMERASLAASPPVGQAFVRVDGAVLVTGGLGGLGSRVARRLASSHGVRDLVLMSRRGPESPGADALVAELAALGAKATVVGGNLADLDSLASVMQLFTSTRPLRGVVHAAGVVDSGILSSLTARKCATVFAPKVDGLWNLHRLTKAMDLDLFMMFSSISGIVGLPGLGNYAAANSFIDALAYLRRAEGLPASSVAYGTWAADGMVTTLVPTTRAHLSQLGLGLLPPEAGLQIFEQAVGQGRALTVAAALDIHQLKAYYGEQGGVPPLLQSMLGEAKAQRRIDEAVNLRDMLADAAPEQHGSIVLHMVRATMAKALGYSRVEHVDAGRPLQELGIDSLTAILTRNHLATLTGMALPPNIALLYPDLKSLSESLLCQLLGDMESGTCSSLETDGATPSTPRSAVSHVDMDDIRRGVLDSTLQFSNAATHAASTPGSPESVFITGATGFVGAFIVYEFLQRGISVYALVRAGSPQTAQERIVETLKQYSLWSAEYEPLLIAVAGDLSRPLLGLCEAVFDGLADRVDAILHSGALVDWMRPLEEYMGPNVLGTHEVLRLASCGRAKAVHFISTISTLPIHAGYGLAAHDREYGYGTSKHLAEKMVAAARFRGAKASSYRLPFVAASATNGHFRLDRGDFLNNLVTGSLDLGVFPLIDGDLSSVLPVDYLCGTIAAMVTEDRQRVGEDYDFVHPQAPAFSYFFKLMSEASGGGELVPFGEWHRRALEYAAAHPKSSLARIAAILDGYTDETVGTLMNGSPVGKHVLGLDVYPAPVLDEEYVRGYLRCIEARAKTRTNTCAG